MSRERRKLLGWAVAAAAGSFAFGYQLGVISGALLFLRRDFGLSDVEQGALVGVVPLMAMVGALSASRLAEAAGRRRTLLADAVVLAAATAIAVIAPSFGVLLAARALAGLGIGIVSSTVPLYLSEISRPEMRGRLVTLSSAMIACGILASYCVDLAFAASGSWRAMFAVGLVPIVVLLAGMARAPESPAWLDAHGRSEEARRVMLEVADPDSAERMLDGFRHARRQQRRAATLRDLGAPDARPALLIGVTLAAAQQFGGINAIVYYGPRIMERTGLSASNAILYSVIIGVVNVAAGLVAVGLVDRAGRRPLLLASLAGMTVSLALLGLTFEVSLGSAGSVLSLVCILGYVAAFSIGMGPVFWLLIAEVFAPATRDAGAGMSTAVNWFSNFVVGLAFLPAAAAIGQGPVFWIFAAVSAIALAFVAVFVPETKGRSLAEIDADVRERWGRRAAAGHRIVVDGGTRTTYRK